MIYSMSKFFYLAFWSNCEIWFY